MPVGRRSSVGAAGSVDVGCEQLECATVRSFARAGIEYVAVVAAEAMRRIIIDERWYIRMGIANYLNIAHRNGVILVAEVELDRAVGYVVSRPGGDTAAVTTD